jgi:hypothetical protein
MSNSFERPVGSPRSLRRRGFLTAALGVGGAGAAAVALKPAAQLSQGNDPQQAAKSRGYHETPHIRQYYQTTKV